MLRVRDLSLSRSGRTVLDRVSFEVAPGEIVALIGANGAGKTSLLESVVGFHRAGGTVSWKDRPLRTLGDRAAVFAFMPDDAQPPAEVRVATLAPDDELGQRLGLRELRGARAGELSRGERRRLALHGALRTARPVIVLDEPLGVFDPLQLLGVLDLLRERTRAGAALLLSIHQLSDADKIADRVLLLHAGRALAFGRRDEIAGGGTLEQAFLERLRGLHA